MKRILLPLVALAMGIPAAFAVPAKPGLRTIAQPDGTTVTAELRGDEYYSFYVDADGNIMNRDARGYIRYMSVTPSGEFVYQAAPAADQASTIRAIKAEALARREAENAISPSVLTDALRRTIARENGEGTVPPQSGMGLMSRQEFPTQGVVKSLVALVYYTDVNFSTPNAGEYFNNMLNQNGFDGYGAVGSVRDYFVENSSNQFLPQFDVFGPIALAHNQAYYGAPSGSRHDIRPAEMATEAIAYIAARTDVSQYDADGDGYIDNLYIIYAGQGQATYGGENTVWPHSSTIINGPMYNGVRLGRYACSNEWEADRPDGIGTFVHEFSHVLGLPDLYETTYTTGAVTPGAWSIMDQGPYLGNGMCPPYYSAYERNALSWVIPEIIDHNAAASCTLPSIDNNKAYLIQSLVDTDFFLLENRQNKKWDTYVPSHGMLVWHIDFDQTVFTNNRVNYDPNHQYVDIVKAQNSGATRWTYPGTGVIKKRKIDKTLKPWVGPVIPLSITDITETEGVITFNCNGGAAAIEPPVALESSDKSAAGFTANWQAVEGAASYELTVIELKNSTVENVTENFGDASTTKITLPEGWTFSGTDDDIYLRPAFCGTAVPAIRINGDSQYLATALYDAEIAKVDFFVRAVTATASCALIIEGRNSESEDWKAVDYLKNLTTLNVRGASFSSDISDSHVRQIRFIYYGDAGRVGLDDITLTMAPTYRAPLADYSNKNVGNITSHAVVLTPEKPYQYFYTVRALDSKGLPTGNSAEIAVDLSDFGAVTDIAVDDANAPVEYYNLQGIRVDNPANGFFIRRQGSSVSKVIL